MHILKDTELFVTFKSSNFGGSRQLINLNKILIFSLKKIKIFETCAILIKSWKLVALIIESETCKLLVFQYLFYCLLIPNALKKFTF